MVALGRSNHVPAQHADLAHHRECRKEPADGVCTRELPSHQTRREERRGRHVDTIHAQYTYTEYPVTVFSRTDTAPEPTAEATAAILPFHGRATQ